MVSAVVPTDVSPPLNGHCSTKVINSVLKGPRLLADCPVRLRMASRSSKYLIGTLVNRAQQSSRNPRTSQDGVADPEVDPKLAIRASSASGEVFVCSISWSCKMSLNKDLIPVYSSLSFDVTSSLRSVTNGEYWSDSA